MNFEVIKKRRRGGVTYYWVNRNGVFFKVVKGYKNLMAEMRA